ncbi:TIGR04086 family membrane protein [Agathobaculum sp. Marseille-P7918]|uniref:TIGR04086 family membrane protein n=1 Tax=Agathobaculum sp. Marseille-P7918 TaxID=2479843 RepID=UPI0013DD8C38|nr:TIGR04086 family membrane protein [Agathobaculum sp. Marseille-P7918]
MRKTNEGPSPVGVLLPAAVAGLLTTLLLMLVGAVLVHRRVLAEQAITPCALIFLAVGCAVAALVSAKRAPGGKFLWAMGAGVLVFLVLLLVSVIPLAQPVNVVRMAVSLLCTLAASALGGFAGANMRKRKKYRHIKK